MGVLQVLLSWVSRVVILLSLLLFVVAGIAKEGSIPLSRASLRVAHLTSLSVWFGTNIWVSFIAGVVLMQVVDMDTFGRVQAHVFDAYFRFSLLCLAVVGFSGAGLAPKSPSVSFMVALTCVVANLVFFGPQTTITLMERQRVCKELGVDRKDPHPEVRKLSKRFGMFHGICNLLNLASAACGVVLMCSLAAKLDL